jgi:hypothetical protein
MKTMLIGFGMGVDVGASVAVAPGVGGRSVAVGAEIVVLRANGVDRAGVAAGISVAGEAQDVNRMANARIVKANLFKAASLIVPELGAGG